MILNGAIVCAAVDLVVGLHAHMRAIAANGSESATFVTMLFRPFWARIEWVSASLCAAESTVIS